MKKEKAQVLGLRSRGKTKQTPHFLMLAHPSSDLQTAQLRLEPLFKCRHRVGWSPPQECLKNSTEQTQHAHVGAPPWQCVGSCRAARSAAPLLCATRSQRCSALSSTARHIRQQSRALPSLCSSRWHLLGGTGPMSCSGRLTGPRCSLSQRSLECPWAGRCHHGTEV